MTETHADPYLYVLALFAANRELLDNNPDELRIGDQLHCPRNEDLAQLGMLSQQQRQALYQRLVGYGRLRLQVENPGGQDQMTLWCEAEDPTRTVDLENLQNLLREITKLRGEVRLVALGSLPNDGKVIEDSRTY